jgi:hypothetical protein
LVLTTTGSIFGGYTPLTWSSRGGYASDPTMKSFIFTITNPHNIPPQIFKQKTQEYARFDSGSEPPRFGIGHDFYVSIKGNSCNSSYSTVGSTYVNETGIAGNQVLTGAYNFTLKEIEVFEVI